MSTAFHEIVPPKNFGVVLIDNDDYLTIKVETDELLALETQDEREAAVKYINDVKKALEGLGATVLVVREAAN